MINQALREGLNKEDLKGIATPIEQIDQLPAVPADHFFQLHEILDDLIGPGFSVRVGSSMKMEDYGVLGLSWKTCSTAGEIFERCERYFMLLSNTYVFRVHRKTKESEVYLNRPSHRRGVELSNEATFAATVVVLKATTESDISPTQISFQHKPPSDLSDYEKAFHHR